MANLNFFTNYCIIREQNIVGNCLINNNIILLIIFLKWISIRKKKISFVIKLCKIEIMNLIYNLLQQWSWYNNLVTQVDLIIFVSQISVNI